MNSIKQEDQVNARIESEEIADQKAWSFIRELNSFSEERLAAVAMVDGTRKYTYRRMFRLWERYAAVFSALGMTEKNHSRVGIVGTPSVESVICFYALNMTGASVSMLSPMEIMNDDADIILAKHIDKEGITDLILSDFLVRPSLVNKLYESRKVLGIRNILLLHSTLAGPFAVPAATAYSWFNTGLLVMGTDADYIEDLLDEFKTEPISYSSGKIDDAAVVIHTSGTTSGIHKPIPLSDSSLNAAVMRMMRCEQFAPLSGRAVSLMGMDLSSSYGMIDSVHLVLAFGGTIVTIPLGAVNPNDHVANGKYKTNVLLGSARIFDNWAKEREKPDLSNLEVVFLGGYYVSAAAKKRCDDYLKKCGAKVRSTNGYGLSEAGGACIVASPERDDDSIGYPLPGVKVKIYSEDENKYYELEDGPRTGVLFVSCSSLSSGRLGDNVFFELEDIDGEKYLNTYDLVSVNEDGSLTCIGRMDKYFVNNDGIRFEAGLIESAVSAEDGILSCGLAPEYDKLSHDTVPVLYVEPEKDAAKAKNDVRNALVNVFINSEKCGKDNLPSRVVITNEIPYNSGGKVDVHRIMSGDVAGYVYNIVPEYRHGKLEDISLTNYGGTGFLQWTSMGNSNPNKNR